MNIKSIIRALVAAPELKAPAAPSQVLPVVGTLLAGAFYGVAVQNIIKEAAAKREKRKAEELLRSGDPVAAFEATEEALEDAAILFEAAKKKYADNIHALRVRHMKKLRYEAAMRGDSSFRAPHSETRNDGSVGGAKERTWTPTPGSADPELAGQIRKAAESKYGAFDDESVDDGENDELRN